MRLALAVAAWALAASFPQGRLYSRQEPDGLLALRAEGTLDAPAWAVREVLAQGWRHRGVTPHLAERRVLGADGCQPGASDLPGCRVVWAYERYDPPVVARRDYTFRMEIVADDLARGGRFEIAWDLDPERGPPPGPEAVRMRVNRGGWLVAAEGTRSRFRYSLAADPGGEVPRWVVAAANRNQIPSVIAAVEEAARTIAAARPAPGGAAAAAGPEPPVGGGPAERPAAP
jgi:hypothetical protein